MRVLARKDPSLAAGIKSQERRRGPMKLRVAGAQLAVKDDDVLGNVDSILRALGHASAEGADILLTPEGALSGYHNRFDKDEVAQALQVVVHAAAAAGIGLALGTCYEEDDGQRYNEIRFYDKRGGLLGFHTKTLRCASLADPSKGEIESFGVRGLQVFSFEGVTVGGLICNDMWANPGCTPMADPHLSQQLADRGARVIFHAVNGARDAGEHSQSVVRSYHESNLRLRALAGKVWIATVDNAFPESLPNSCTGGVISPDGDWVTRAPQQGEAYYTYTIRL